MFEVLEEETWDAPERLTLDEWRLETGEPLPGRAEEEPA